MASLRNPSCDASLPDEQVRSLHTGFVWKMGWRRNQSESCGNARIDALFCPKGDELAGANQEQFSSPCEARGTPMIFTTNPFHL